VLLCLNYPVPAPARMDIVYIGVGRIEVAELVDRCQEVQNSGLRVQSSARMMIEEIMAKVHCHFMAEQI
jgi:hypothetical protein